MLWLALAMLPVLCFHYLPMRCDNKDRKERKHNN